MARKGENITKRKDGRWEARVIKGYDSNGKAQYAYLYAKSYYEAKQKKQNYFQNISVKKKCVEAVLLNAIISDFLLYQQNKSKISTISQYKRIIDKHILPDFGNKRLNDITASNIDLFIYEKMNTTGSCRALSSKTIRDILTLFKSILVFAKEHSYCNEIPVFSLPRKEKGSIDLLSENEQYRLWKSVTENY